MRQDDLDTLRYVANAARHWGQMAGLKHLTNQALHAQALLDTMEQNGMTLATVPIDRDDEDEPMPHFGEVCTIPQTRMVLEPMSHVEACTT